MNNHTNSSGCSSSGNIEAVCAVLNSSKNLIWSVDLEYRVLAYNRALEKHLVDNYGTHIAVGISYEAALPEAGRGKWKEHFERALNEGDLEFDYWSISGDVLFRVFMTPIYEGQTAKGVAVHATDITLQRKTEEALADYNEKLESMVDARTADLRAEIKRRVDIEAELMKSEEASRHLFESNQDAVFLLHQHRVVYCNDAALLLFDREPSEMAGIALWALSPERQTNGTLSQDQLLEIYNRVMKGASERIDWEFTDKKGEPLLVEITFAPTFFYGESVVYCSLHDIAWRKAHEKKLQSAQLAAEFANRAKSDFLANMSHEIRTPINAIIGYYHLLKSTAMSEKQKDYVEKSMKSAQILLSLITNILDISKIEAGKLEFEHVPFNMDRLWGNLDSVAQVYAAQKSLELTFVFSEDMPQRLVGDPVRLNQVLNNLINNAIKFTEMGSVKVSGTLIGIDGNLAKIRFEVADTGVGMTPEQQEKLFKPFSQADTSISRKYGGTGLGLSISQNLVEAMGGKIELKSSLGKGSCFSFELEIPLADRIIEAENEAIEIQMIRFTSVKIIVADDNAVNRHLIKEILENVGIEASLASNGLEVVQAIEQGSAPDMIIMDIHMPEMDGYEAARRISALSDVPIVALTADAMGGVKEAILESGMKDYLSKPLNLDRLFGVMLKWIAPDKISLVFDKPAMTEVSDSTNWERKVVFAFPEFDISGALKVMSGNRSLYKNVLNKFIEESESIGQRLLDAGTEQDEKKLCDIAHLLKGMSAAIGASHLNKTASLIEEKIKAHELQNDLGFQAHSLLNALQLAVEVVTRVVRFFNEE